MPLRTLCTLALAAMLPALLLPGLILTNTRSRLLAPLLFTQAALLAALEEHLYSSAHDEGSGTLYPAYLLAATAAAGWMAARWLRKHGFVGHYGCWALQCVCVSKLAVLVVPEVRHSFVTCCLLAHSHMCRCCGNATKATLNADCHHCTAPQARLLLPVLLMTMACSLPLAVHQARMEHGHLAARTRVTPAQGIAMAVLVLLTVALSRFAIFDVVRWAVEGRPSESLLLGLLLLTAALGCAPLVRLLFPGAAGPQRMLVVGITGGLLLVLLRPPLPIQACTQLVPYAQHRIQHHPYL